MCSNKTDEVLYDVSLEETKKDHIVWYWLDLYKPTKEEYTYTLQDHFKFHPLAIEDCIEYVQRPKVDFYDGYNFLVLHAFGEDGLEPHKSIYLLVIVILFLSTFLITMQSKEYGKHLEKRSI